MTDELPREPFSALRADEPPADARARARARGLLDARIAPPGRRRLRLPARSRGRWVGAFAGAVLVAGAGAGVAAILSRTEHTGHLPVFAATGTLNPRFHVGSRGSGYCWTASLATQAPDAYRCFQGNAIHDPCFAPPHGGDVACFIDPWHAVTLLRLTRPLPSHGPPAAGPVLPWAILTRDGRRCVFLTGATAPMGGERINYGCIGGSVLIGAPRTRDPLWTIRSARGYHADPPGHTVPIARYPLVAIAETVP
jgi:hypothetical protein